MTASTEDGQPSEVQALRDQLTHKDNLLQQHREQLKKYHDSIVHTKKVVQRAKKESQRLKETEKLLLEKDLELGLMQEEAADAARLAAQALQASEAATAAAQQASREAAAATRGGAAARSEAAAATRQLAELRGQLEVLKRQQSQQAASQQVAQLAAAAGGEPDQLPHNQQQQADSQQLIALQRQLEMVQNQQSGMLADMHQWKAAFSMLQPVAAGAAPALALPAPPPAALPSAPAPASVPVPAASPPRQPRQRQRGPASPRPAPTTNRTGTTAAAATAAIAAALPPPPPPPTAEETRAKAVAARQAGAGSKRPRATADAAAAPAAQANVFADLLGDMQQQARPKRARQPSTAAALATAAAATTAAAAPARQQHHQQQQQQQQRRGLPSAAPLRPSNAAAGEASLAISANELHVEQQREQATAVEEAAQQLSRITAAGGGPGGPGPELGMEAVRQVAAELHKRLAEQRLPLPLLVSCFESAVLSCAAAKAQLQYLYLHPHTQQQQAGGNPDTNATQQIDVASAPSASAWFEPTSPAPSEQQEEDRQEGDRRSDRQKSGSLPSFAAVWCSREAMAGHHVPWLLHCAAHIQQLERQYAGAAAAAAGSPRAVGAAGRNSSSHQLLLPALRLHLHRLVLGCCLAARRQGNGGGGGGGGSAAGDCSSSAVRHTETEVCALAATAAGLCRATGYPEAFWALVLDLIMCPAPAANVLPPLAAALDVWPSLVGFTSAPPATAATADASSSAEFTRASLQAALQQLCLEAATADAAAGSVGQGSGAALPPASLFLRRLGQQMWGWGEEVAADSEALPRIKSVLGLVLRPAAGEAEGTVVAVRPPSPPPPSPPAAAAAAEDGPAGDGAMEAAAADSDTRDAPQLAGQRAGKRKVALFIGYSGTGRRGLQMQPSSTLEDTIEDALEEAIFLAGGILPTNRGNLAKIGWSRSSRTDKSVHSLATVVGLKMEVGAEAFEADPEGQQLAAAINSHLPPEVRVFSVQRVSKSWNARSECIRRSYSYYVPASVLGLALDGGEEDQRRLSLLRQVWESFQGTHPFHNYTKRRLYREQTSGSDYRAGQGRRNRGQRRQFDSSSSGGSSEGAELEVEEGSDARKTVEGSGSEESSSKESSGSSPKQDGGVEAASDSLASLASQSNSSSSGIDEAVEAKEAELDESMVEGEDAGGSDATSTVVRKGRVQVAWKHERDEADPVVRRHYRFIEWCKASDGLEQLVPGGQPCIHLTVQGGSFMLHQIRKMVGMAVGVARGSLPLSLLEPSLSTPARINLPLAPPSTLMLTGAQFSPFKRSWSGQAAAAAQWTGEVLQLKEQGVAAQRQFLQEAMLPALDSLLAGEEWHQWEQDLDRLWCDEGQVAEVLEAHAAWRRQREAAKLEVLLQEAAAQREGLEDET